MGVPRSLRSLQEGTFWPYLRIVSEIEMFRQLYPSGAIASGLNQWSPNYKYGLGQWVYVHNFPQRNTSAGLVL